GLLPFALFGTRQGIKRYTILVALLLSTIKCISIINIKMPDQVVGMGGIFSALSRFSGLTYIVIALWTIVIILYIGDNVFFKGKADWVGRWLRIGWLILLITGVMALVWILYDANLGGHAEKYGAFSQYLVFNDNWGTRRGYCWRIAWESYMQQPLIHKLFGFGPDTFGILTWGFREEALNLYGEFYESTHNEYLQYLVTMGPFALISYVGFLASSCVMMIKGLKKQPWVLAPLLAVICYGVQAIVNINLPIATPIMWTLLAVGMAMCRTTACKTS
ncbi:MAG: O-antigen ligase family protein, partial [Lachnospiraceae bacterium]